MFDFLYNFLFGTDCPYQYAVIDPVIGGAIIAAVGSIVAGLFSNHSSSSSQSAANKTNIYMTEANNATNERIAQATNLMNLRIAQETNQWTADQALRMFNLENQYNSPVEVMKRLAEAGINPSVAMGGSLGSAMTQAGDASSPVGEMIPAQGYTSEAPHVEPTQNRSSAIEAMSALADSVNKVSSSFKNTIEGKATAKKLSAEVDNILADTKAKAAKAKYDEVIAGLEALYGGAIKKRQVKLLDEQIKKTLNEAVTEAYRGELTATDVLVRTLDREIQQVSLKMKKDEAEILDQQKPWLIDNAKRAVELLIEQRNTEKAKQKELAASEDEHRAVAEEHKEKAREFKSANDRREMFKSLLDDEFGADVRNKLTQHELDQLYMDFVKKVDTSTPGKFLRGWDYYWNHITGGASSALRDVIKKIK